MSIRLSDLYVKKFFNLQIYKTFLNLPSIFSSFVVLQGKIVQLLLKKNTKKIQIKVKNNII